MVFHQEVPDSNPFSTVVPFLGQFVLQFILLPSPSGRTQTIGHPFAHYLQADNCFPACQVKKNHTQCQLDPNYDKATVAIS